MKFQLEHLSRRTRIASLVRTTIEGQIFTMSGKTPYTRFGALLMNSLLIFGVLLIVVNRLIGWRQAVKKLPY